MGEQRTEWLRARNLAWVWPLATATLVLVSLTLALLLATRQPRVEIVYVEKPASAAVERPTANDSRPTSTEQLPSTAFPSPPIEDKFAAARRALPRPAIVDRPRARFGDDYFSLRERVLAHGVDVLPSSPAAPFSNEPATVTDSRYGALLGQLRGG